jgi:cobalt-zinc-cadmium efflux system outer membrane protein
MRSISATCFFTLIIGCASTGAKAERIVATPRPSINDVGIRQVAHEISASLNLADLLDLAARQNPDLIAARAKVDEAQGKVIQAGLYPNPTVGYLGNQINDGPGTSGQQGGFISQEIVTGGKRKVAQSAMGHGLTAAEQHAVTRWFEIAARVRIAYAEAMTARAVAKEADIVLLEFETGLAKAEALARAGTALAYEVSRWRVEVHQARFRSAVAKQRVETADRMLAAAVGMPQLPAPVENTALSSDVPILNFDALATVADNSPAIADVASRVEQARCEVHLAELQNVPNVTIQAGAAQDAISNSAIANVQTAVTLPVWNRNQGNVRAAQARLAAAVADVEKLRLQQRERLAAAVQKAENARRQIELLDRNILPDANKAVDQVRQIYEARGERFFELLDAQKTLAQARIDRLDMLGSLHAALAEIEAACQRMNGQSGDPNTDSKGQ